MRLDKWIWAVQMVKSRTQAIDFCKSGKVKVNGENGKPAKDIKIDDLIEIKTRDWIKKYKVTGFLEKRASVEIAAKNYEDLSPTEQPQNLAITAEAKVGVRLREAGRPTKKERREIEKFLDCD